MKNSRILWINAVLAAGIFIAVQGASASVPPVDRPDTGDGVRQEILIGNIFVPETGYEDKNNIEITLDGYLPNGCFQIADTQVEKKGDPFTMTIHQFAEKRTDGACSDPEALPAGLRYIVPYTIDVNLGHLAPGDYRLLFNIGSSPARASDFHVAHSTTPAVDDYPYASVSAVEIPDVVNGANPVTANLVGRLVTTCQYIRRVKILPEPMVDVIVILPILGTRHGFCGQIVFPFKYTVNLGRLGEGRYLIHVRTQNGRAVTRVFSVVRPDPSSGQSVP